MAYIKKIVLGSALFAFAASANPVTAQKRYDPGASDTEIKIGQTMPYSGPASAYSTIAKAEAAYFRMINESDEVLLTFQILGTPSNAAVQKYLNTKKVPQLFTATGATRFTDPKRFPWTMGYNPSYQTEGGIYARYIMDNYPNAKIGVLYQNDDFGKDYLTGLKDGLGSKAASMIVAEFPYEVTDPTIDSQMVGLKAAGVDLLYNVTTPKFASQSIKKAAQMGWKPVHILNINSTSVGGVLAPAGFENAKGIISVNYGKDPGDPTWNDDPGMKKWRAFMDKYYPEGDKNSSFNTYGYGTAELMVKVLEMCGDELTRENVMKQATSLKDVTGDLSLADPHGRSQELKESAPA